MAISRRGILLKVFEACKRLQLPISTTITAIITTHRYIDFVSIEKFHCISESVQLSAICFLSCKLDEHTRSLRDVISVVREIYRRNKQRAVSSSNSSKPDLYREEMEYPAIREAVIAQEQVLLRATAFNTRADIPHKYLLNVARALCLSCPVVQYAYALLNDCFLDARCMDMSSMALACACLHLGVLYVCLEEGGGGEGGGGEDPTETCQPQQRLPSSDFATLPALLPSEAPTARACLKVPAHELHGVLRSAWWSLHFDVSHDDFWNTAAFVVHANSSSGTVEEDSVSCGSEKN